ncbi:polyribonucleotide nucleotidyltransferase [Butyrivibrio sp. AE2032]|uniref:polyribonucleotide nucleotidyltransferase n=1 Tax=Butyrivibrio sp. AE2032 TaxID=1458463 RepID=UPI0008311DE1|nr:polyribonucleotide nucleotidyltransferase [Butyrivibrio sp. AE2032]
MEKIFRTEIAGRPLVVETGKIAQFANGSALVRYGETTVLSTATASATPREGIDFFPLSVDYEEKMYAVGKMPGGFLKREGRPGEKAILVSRVIDRPIRPLFPKDLRNDVCVNNLVMSVDPDCSPEITAMLGTSIAIAISDIPWKGPVGGVVLGLIDGKTIINPTLEQREVSDMYVTLAGTLNKICMVEAGANEVPDDVMLNAIAEGHEEIKKICEFINSIVAEIGKEKFTYESADVPEEIFEAVKEYGWDKMRAAVLSKDKEVRDANVAALQEEVAALLEEKEEGLSKWAPDAIYKLEKKVVRDYLFREHIRVDGRALDEIRPLSCAVGVLPRVHGSSFFQRGQTQVMNICTLAPLDDAQKLEGLDEQTYKRYMHHYNFPGYSTGEAKPSKSPGRREIGHGALAERSLIPVLPSEEEFPYSIRTVSEITMSNGSTSQGSVCASTLSLMDAGVPIKRPVAGISSGLITDPDNDDNFLVFMDIQGIEDFFGDMDFKVAGTTEGITSIQVDIKVEGLTLDIIKAAFEMTHKGRLQIINDIILPCIPAPRAELNKWAPRIISMQVPVDKIREVIGSGGKVINKIIADTGAQININDDGMVYISTPDLEKAEKAKMIINGIVSDPEVGTEYDGVVTRLMDFGAFVEFLPGKEGLVHISKMAWNRVEKVEDVLHEGDKVHVKLIEIDSQGRLNLSIRDCLPKPEGFVEEEPRRREGRPNRERRGGFAGRNGGRRPFNDDDDGGASENPKGRRREF